MLDPEIPDWARSCPSGKRKFASADDAWDFRRASRKARNGSLQGTMHIYRCPDCQMFHFTTKPRKRNKKKGRRG